MRWYRGREEELRDGLGREIDGFDLLINDTEDGFFAEGNEDDLAGD